MPLLALLVFAAIFGGTLADLSPQEQQTQQIALAFVDAVDRGDAAGASALVSPGGVLETDGAVDARRPLGMPNEQTQPQWVGQQIAQDLTYEDVQVLPFVVPGRLEWTTSVRSKTWQAHGVDATDERCQTTVESGAITNLVCVVAPTSSPDILNSTGLLPGWLRNMLLPFATAVGGLGLLAQPVLRHRSPLDRLRRKAP